MSDEIGTPTPGAIRAAEDVLGSLEWWDGDVSRDGMLKELAEVIDRETGCAEMLAALKATLDMGLEYAADSGYDMAKVVALPWVAKAEAAIARATPEETRRPKS